MILVLMGVAGCEKTIKEAKAPTAAGASVRT
jgi:hypothetical protein